MKSIFSKMFYSIIISSLLVLASMLLFSLIAIQTSIFHWNQGKTEELEALLMPIITKANRLSGGLSEKNLESILSPYMTDSLYVYIYDEQRRPIFAMNQGKRLSLQNKGEGKIAVQPSLEQAPVVEIWDGENIIGYLSAANVDFFTYKANREFIRTIERAAIGGSIVTVLLALLVAALFSFPISRQTREVVEGLTHLGMGERDVDFDKLGTLELNMIAQSASKLQKQLTQEEQLRHQWMQDISHDLRTPVTAMKAQFEAMIDGVLDTGEGRLSGLLAELTRVELLVNNLQELSRYESPEMKISPQFISAASFLGDMQDRFSFLALQKGVELRCEGAENAFYGDEQLMQRCVSNIIQNAIQYTENGGRVVLRIAVSAQETTLSVDNTGAIPERDLEHLFDRLYRGNRARSGTGSGLGLSIAKAIMDLHGGTIHAENHDGLARFVLTIPTPSP